MTEYSETVPKGELPYLMTPSLCSLRSRGAGPSPDFLHDKMASRLNEQEISMLSMSINSKSYSIGSTKLNKASVSAP